MKLSAVIALGPFIGAAVSQGVTSIITPENGAPATCSPKLDGSFQIIIVDVDGDPKVKRDMNKMYSAQGACRATDGEFIGELSNGVLTDNKNRTGYIASNYQLQFDAPPQAGAMFTGGFSHCPNGSLALGNSTVFYKCQSGNFWNLYDRWWAEQCTPISIIMRQCDAQGEIGPNDHPVGSVVITTTMVVPFADGQPQLITTTIVDPICEIDDGQLQGQTTPCAAIAGVSKQVTFAPASQLSDGQIQVTPAGPAPSLHSTLVTASISIPTSSVMVPSPSTPRVTPGPSTATPEKPQVPVTETKTGGGVAAVHINVMLLMMGVLLPVWI